MPEPELDPKLLDRSLDSYDRRRDAFFRDLGAAAVVLVTAQFLIFFGILNLTTQRQNLQKKAAERRVEKSRLAAEQAPLKAVAAGVNDLRQGLTDFDSRLEQRQTQKQDQLKKDLLALATWAQRRAKDPELMEAPPLPTDLLRGKLLDVVKRDQNFTLPASRDAFADIVRDGICTPALEKLNDDKDHLFRETYADRAAQLLSVLRTDFYAHDDLKAVAQDLEKELTGVSASLANVRFKVAPRLEWDQQRLDEYMGQKGEARNRNIVEGGIAVHEGVKEGDDNLKAAAATLAGIQRQVGQRQAETDVALAGVSEELTHVEADLKQAEEQSEKFVSTWSVVVPSPDILVRYYPVALVAVLGWLAWRSLRLRRLAERLARVLRGRGVAEEVLAANYPELTATPGRQGLVVRGRPLTPGLTLLAWAVPGVLAIVSMAVVLTSEVYGAPPGRGPLLAVYAATAVALAGIYTALAQAVTRPAQD